MTEKLPTIDLLQGAGSDYFVVIGDTEKATDLGQFLGLAPDLVQPENATVLARVVNHLSQGRGFSVIEDPGAFAEAYQAQLAKEDPSAPWQEGVIRLTDFGIPDYTSILKPELTGQHLVYFARNGFTGLPYRTEVDLSRGRGVTDDDYKAVDLDPVDDEDDFDAVEELTDEDRAFIARLATTSTP